MSLYKFVPFETKLKLVDANNTMGIDKEDDWARVFYYTSLQSICLVTNLTPEEVDSGLYDSILINACINYGVYLRDLYHIVNAENKERKEILTERLSETNHLKNVIIHNI